MKPSDVINVLQSLIKPTSDTSLSLEEALNKKLEACRIDLAPKSVEPDKTFSSHRESLNNYAWWNFVRTISHTLWELKLSLEFGTEEDSLLSVNQKKTISEALEMLISFGILAHLPEGVGIGLESRSTTHTFLPLHNVTPLQKFLCTEYVCHILLLLMTEETLWSTIKTRHLSDLLAALFTILLFNETPSFKEEFATSKRNYYKTKLSEILETTYQPLVIRELMVLLGNKKCPIRLSRALRGLLTDRLMVEGGVVATLRSITDVTGSTETPKNNNTIDIISRLIITPHTKDINAYYKRICPTVISLLTSDEKQFMQISVLCIRNLYETKPDLCQQHFLTNFYKPFREPTSEQQINLTIERLFNCFAIPSSDMWSLPVEILLPFAKSLFRLHFKIVHSACSFKSKVEDLIWHCFEIDAKEFRKVFEDILFSKCDISFEFGEEAGVISVKSEDESFLLEDASDCILNLLVKRDSNGKIKTILFHCLIEILTETGEQPVERKLIATKMLSVLSTEADVYKNLNSNPTPIVEFLRNILERKCSAFDSEIVSLGLMVLGVILSDTEQAKNRDWGLFTCLVEPLKNLKLECSEELKMLADEIYCMILTHGVVSGSVLKPAQWEKLPREVKIEELHKTINETVESECDVAIKEACDALLPVRGQALRTLARLVLAGDFHAKAKKQAILCIFKENLKDSDSYIYLNAVEGMASMGSIYPNEVLLALTEQYIYCKEYELRLKVGEVLIKVTRTLGELVYNYKAELLNAFLYGCRDTDPVVRASSLSNLGELCKILTFRIGVFAIEIFDCVQSIFETDKAAEARRAALMVLTLVLKGLGTSALSVLEPVLLEMYRRLKKAYHNERDEVTKLQAQLALEELSILTREYLMPKQQLTKRIYVLDPPP